MKGKWHGAPFRDFKSKKWLITFEIEEEPVVYDQTKDEEIDLNVKTYRNKRSLSANSYFHVLVDKIADRLGISHNEAHNRLIADYGVVDEDLQNIIMDDDVDWQKLDTIHLRPTMHTRLMDNGKLYRIYLVMRGSHTYDTKEMSRLIDGTVREAQELGIETLTPDEIERMKAQWKVS